MVLLLSAGCPSRADRVVITSRTARRLSQSAGIVTRFRTVRSSSGTETIDRGAMDSASMVDDSGKNLLSSTLCPIRENFQGQF